MSYAHITQLLDAVGVSHSYRHLPVLSNITLTLSPGEAVAIMAPSGSGKTTLLRILLGLELPRDGGVQLHLPTKDIGVAFQEDNLLPWFNVVENASLLNSLANRPIDHDLLSSLM